MKKSIKAKHPPCLGLNSRPTCLIYLQEESKLNLYELISSCVHVRNALHIGGMRVFLISMPRNSGPESGVIHRPKGWGVNAWDIVVWLRAWAASIRNGGGCFGRVQGGLFLSFGHATPRCTDQEVQHLNL